MEEFSWCSCGKQSCNVKKEYKGRFPKGHTRARVKECVYVIKGVAGWYKIGQTTSSLINRLRNLQNGSPVELEVVQIIKSPQPIVLEKLLHEKFADRRGHGEWFKLDKKCLEEIREVRMMYEAL